MSAWAAFVNQKNTRSRAKGGSLNPTRLLFPQATGWAKPLYGAAPKRARDENKRAAMENLTLDEFRAWVEEVKRQEASASGP